MQIIQFSVLNTASRVGKAGFPPASLAEPRPTEDRTWELYPSAWGQMAWRLCSAAGGAATGDRSTDQGRTGGLAAPRVLAGGDQAHCRPAAHRHATGHLESHRNEHGRPAACRQTAGGLAGDGHTVGWLAA
jgi:hypothetical protein